MLLQLSIRNIAVIERAEINFGGGLNILSGETGAGKSIIIDSVNLILGQRADRTLIRKGAESAYVEALFDISNCLKVRKTLYEMFDDNDSELVISRELSSSGRNICRINGKMATLSQLANITDDLVDIHGQHEHQSLLNPKNHITVLDAFCQPQLNELLHDYSKLLKEYKSVSDRIVSLETDDLEKQRRLDILSFQLYEIDSMSLKIGEEESLRSDRDELQHAEKIKESFSVSSAMFSGEDIDEGIVTRLSRATRALETISDISQEYKELAERLETLYIESEDLAAELSRYEDSDSYAEKDLDFIEGRISDINKLKRKYGTTIEEILDYRDSIKKQISDLEENEFIVDDLLKKKKSLYAELEKVSSSISAVRKTNGQKLSDNIVDQLSTLGMERARFQVGISTRTDADGGLTFGSDGTDSVEFLIATNPGEDLKSLNKIASGGEISRIMLALKTISSETDNIETLIFDEIDTGISGNMASVVAQKLAKISVNHQTICVTHTAQIAAMADHHSYIEKTTDSTSAKTEVKILNENERYVEISRLVGGNSISQFSEAHAKEMILWSAKYKAELS